MPEEDIQLDPPEDKHPRTYAFIDAQNLHLGAKDGGVDLDYGKFRKYLKEKYGVERAYMFIGYLQKNSELYSKRQEQGYILRFKPVIPAKTGDKQEGNVDAHLAFYVMVHYHEYEQAILVTSDGDFDVVAKYLRKKKKLAAVISPNRDKCSALLKKAAADKMQFLQDIGSKVGKDKKEIPDLSIQIAPEIEKAPLEDETSSSAPS